MGDKVSVIIPTYNRAEVIERALDSVKSQTYRNFQIVVVDDASNDNTEIVIRQYKNKNSQIDIVYIRYDENRGACYARNLGVKSSDGNYIAFLDSDNIYTPTSLEDKVNLLKQGNDFVFSKTIIHNGTDGFVFPRVDDEKLCDVDAIIKQMAIDNVIDTNTVCMHRNVFVRNHGFNVNVKRFQDWEFFYRVLESGQCKVAFLKKILVHGYWMPNSISMNPRNLFECRYALFQKHIDDNRRFNQVEKCIQILMDYNELDTKYSIKELCGKFAKILSDKEFQYFLWYVSSRSGWLCNDKFLYVELNDILLRKAKDRDLVVYGNLRLLRSKMNVVAELLFKNAKYFIGEDMKIGQLYVEVPCISLDALRECGKKIYVVILDDFDARKERLQNMGYISGIDFVDASRWI